MVSNSNISELVTKNFKYYSNISFENFALELAKNQGLNITSLFILIVYIVFYFIITVHQSQKRSELDEKEMER